MDAILEGLRNALTAIVTILPRVAFFLVILVVGLVVAKLLTTVLAKVLARLGLNRLVDRGGSRLDAADVISKVIFYTLVLFVLSTAFGVFGPDNPVSRFLAAIVAYLPLVFVAILIVLIAAAVAAAAKRLIQNSLGGLSYGRAVANAVSGLILALGVIAALDELGVAENVVNGIFYASLAALVGIAVVAVGGGGIAPMRSRWDAVLARYDEEKPRMAEQVGNTPQTSEPATHAGNRAATTPRSASSTSVRL